MDSKAPHDTHDPDPMLCMAAVVLMLSSFAPSAKYVFSHGNVSPFDLALLRVLIGFVFLIMIALFWDRTGIFFLRQSDLVRLILLGILGVGLAYTVAAWGLANTSATHYVLIYSLTPSLTMVFSFLAGRDQTSRFKILGILVSFVGCVIAVSEGFRDSPLNFGFGDALVLLFAIMMSASIVLSAGVVKRYGAITANIVMFGSSFLLLSLGAFAWEEPSRENLSFMTTMLIIYIGVTTAAVFLLRYLALQSLTPVTVGAFHNLVPVCAILIAHVFLGESVEAHTVVGGAMILAGTEAVRRA